MKFKPKELVLLDNELRVVLQISGTWVATRGFIDNASKYWSHEGRVLSVKNMSPLEMAIYGIADKVCNSK